MGRNLVIHIHRDHQTLELLGGKTLLVISHSGFNYGAQKNLMCVYMKQRKAKESLW